MRSSGIAPTRRISTCSPVTPHLAGGDLGPLKTRPLFQADVNNVNRPAFPPWPLTEADFCYRPCAVEAVAKP